MCLTAIPSGGSRPEVSFRIRHRPVAKRAAARRRREVEVRIRHARRSADATATTVRRALGETSALDDFVASRYPQRLRERSLKPPKPNRAAGLLKKAHAWQARIESGEVENKAAVARQEGISRARVTQVLSLLKLAPEIREHILAMPLANGHRPLSERSLRPLIGLPPSRQLAQFKRLQRVR